jgi:hypothetical protein
VSFTPVEYGKERLGKLIIQTDTRYYSYNVVGTFPPYEPPKDVKGKVLDMVGLRKKPQKDLKRDRDTLL